MIYPSSSLGVVGTIIMGLSPSGEKVSFISDHGLPLLNGPTEFGSVSPTPRQWATSWAREAQVGDILFCVRGSTTGRTNVADQPYAIGRGIAAIRGDTPLDTKYIHYAITEGLSRLLALTSGSVFPNLSVGDIRSFNLSWPESDVRAAIAGTLGALDDKIESNRRAVDLAMGLARAQVDTMIANRDFVPYDRSLNVRMGSAFKGSAFSAPGVGRPLLRIRDLKTFESQIWTTEVRRDETVISPGDNVVGMDAEFRATLWLGVDSVLNQRVCSFTGKPGVGRAFVLAVLEPQLAFQESSKTGTTVIHLNKADIDMFQVPNLSAEEHVELFKLTEPLIDLVVARSIENRQLAKLRDMLLSELLFGRISIDQAAVVAEGVLA